MGDKTLFLNLCQCTAIQVDGNRTRQIKDNVCIHDDYHFYADESVRKIPHLKFNNEFIGQPVNV